MMTHDNLVEVINRIMSINKNLSEESLLNLLNASGWEKIDIDQALSYFKSISNSSSVSASNVIPINSSSTNSVMQSNPQVVVGGANFNNEVKVEPVMASNNYKTVTQATSSNFSKPQVTSAPSIAPSVAPALNTNYSSTKAAPVQSIHNSSSTTLNAGSFSSSKYNTAQSTLATTDYNQISKETSSEIDVEIADRPWLLIILNVVLMLVLIGLVIYLITHA